MAAGVEGHDQADDRAEDKPAERTPGPHDLMAVSWARSCYATDPASYFSIQTHSWAGRSKSPRFAQRRWTQEA